VLDGVHFLYQIIGY